jgi:hypothetical protein
MRQKLAFITFLVLFALTAKVGAKDNKDYADVLDGKEVSWDVTAQDLIRNLRTDINVVWFGEVKQRVVFRNQQGITVASWLCEQHRFKNPCGEALKEPLEVIDSGSGHFVVSLQFPTLSPEQAYENILSILKEPSYVVLQGRPIKIEEFEGGIPAIMLNVTGKMYISDEILVNFTKPEQLTPAP